MTWRLLADPRSGRYQNTGSIDLGSGQCMAAQIICPSVRTHEPSRDDFIFQTLVVILGCLSCMHLMCCIAVMYVCYYLNEAEKLVVAELTVNV
jgi:hypothetical protein